MKISPITNTTTKITINNARRTTYQQSFGSFYVKNNFTLNPILHYGEKLYERSVIASKQKFATIITPLKGHVKTKNLITTDKKEITCIEIPAIKKTDEYIVFLHGASQNVYSNQPLYSKLREKGYNIFAVEYRGYGKNKEADSSVKLMTIDVETALDYLNNKKKIKDKNISIIGHSLGTILACNVGVKHPSLKSIVLVSPISNTKSLADASLLKKSYKMPTFWIKICKSFNFLFTPLEKFSKINKHLKELKPQVHIIHSKNDKLIPVEEVINLVKSTNNVKYLHLMENGGHRMDDSKISLLCDILEKI